MARKTQERRKPGRASKLSLEQREAVCKDYYEDMKQDPVRTIAAKHGIGLTTLYRIVDGAK